jgi:hypothetical protein
MKHVKRNTENVHQVEIKALVSYIATGDFSRLQENYLLWNHKSMNKKWPNLFLDATISFLHQKHGKIHHKQDQNANSSRPHQIGLRSSTDADGKDNRGNKIGFCQANKNV